MQLFDPRLHIVEGRELGDVKDKNSGVSFAVIHGSHRAKTFLSSGIPNLQRKEKEERLNLIH